MLFVRLQSLFWSFQKSTAGDRAIAHVLWNSLPSTIRTSSSLAIFKKQLKTFLFKKAFDLLDFKLAWNFVLKF